MKNHKKLNNQVPNKITNSNSHISSIQGSVFNKVTKLTGEEEKIMNKLDKLDPLSGLKELLNIELYKEFICSLLKEEKTINSNKESSLYSITFEGTKYYVEIKNSLENDDISPTFGTKIKKLISVSTYNGKLYVIYL